MSNLSYVSKLLERVVVQQLNEHLKTNNLLEPYQSAYKPNHSTETALVKVHNDIVVSVSEGKSVLLVLLDLSAAFDTVEHELLLQFLQDNGVDGIALQWFRSYLTDRSQQVVVNGEKSERVSLQYGVPQGSVLGPVLFTIYTASLGRLLRKINKNYHLYADDSQVQIAFKPDSGGTENAINAIQTCVKFVQQWMCAHMLKMNPDKTEVVMVSSPRLSNEKRLSSILLDDTITQVSTAARNIGVIFDSHLSMVSQVDSICRRSYCQLRNLARLRPILDKKSLADIAQSILSSQLDYCNAVLIGLPDTTVNRLQKIQNTAARIVTGSRRHDHITPVLAELHWLPVEFRIKFKVLLIVYKCLNGIAPGYLKDLLTIYTPSRELRSKSDILLDIPFTRSAFAAERAFSVVGPRLWNDLPFDLKTSPSVKTFKKNLKTYFCRIVFD